MPIILRIIVQRLIAAMLAFLTFLGLSPEATIPTEEEAEFRVIEQRRIIDNILNIERDDFNYEDLVPDADDTYTNTDLDSDNQEPVPSQPSAPVPQPTIKTPSPQPVAESTVPEPPVTNPVPKPDQNEVYEVESEGEMEELSDVLVNIICSQRKNNMTAVSTGSGVIVSPNGVVLTNAHVAQFFVLEDAGYDMECALYKENIPTFGYRADIMYISPQWVSDNHTTISNPNPRGTGERDFALLLITKNTNPVLSIPESFSHAKINLDSEIYKKEQSIRIAGFPGTPMNIFDLAQAGSLKIDSNKIQDVFTFKRRNDLDIFSTYATPVAARGASGGGIFYQNDLIGITVTISSEGGGSKINAITTTYINQAVSDELDRNFSNLIFNDPHDTLQQFQTEHVPNMAKLLGSQI